MTRKQEEPVSKAITLLAGVMFLVEGVTAYITGLNIVAAIILVIMGIGGLIFVFRRPRGEDET